MIENIIQLLQQSPLTETHKPSEIALNIWEESGYPDIKRLVNENKITINMDVPITSLWQPAKVWGIDTMICGVRDILHTIT